MPFSGLLVRKGNTPGDTQCCLGNQGKDGSRELGEMGDSRAEAGIRGEVSKFKKSELWGRSWTEKANFSLIPNLSVVV